MFCRHVGRGSSPELATPPVRVGFRSFVGPQPHSAGHWLALGRRAAGCCISGCCCRAVFRPFSTHHTMHKAQRVRALLAAHVRSMHGARACVGAAAYLSMGKRCGRSRWNRGRCAGRARTAHRETGGRTAARGMRGVAPPSRTVARAGSKARRPKAITRLRQKICTKRGARADGAREHVAEARH